MDTLISLTLRELLVAIVVALFMAGIGIAIGRLRARIRARRAQRKTDRDLSVFASRMLDSGVSNFYVGREDWARYRTPPDLGDYLMEAKHSIDIACYWMAQGVLSGIPQTLGRAAEAGRTVRVVTLDPSGPSVLALSIELGVPAPDIRRNIRTTHQTLREVRAQLSSTGQEHFEICTTRILPQAAVILLDRGHETSVVQLEFRPYRTARAHSFSIELRNRKGASLHALLDESWTSFFSDSDRLDP